ncbi:hypothetical protein [Paraflavitalea speifideaquila]|uniref:TolB family protein n=1 Tax=Paraflavitalea speifideaquila TaxID=3076558 RepID=UPI0028F0BCA5|nr:hypothetical protein [Paraflavitalea speifideiaquila]
MPVLLTSGLNGYSAMTWSPDDTRILFLKWTLGTIAASDVFVIDSDGKNEKQLTTDGRNLYPHWFPDGRKIIYNSRGNTPGVFVMTTDWSGSWRIGQVGAANANLVISPKGDKIAFAFDSPGENRSLLYVMNADGSKIAYACLVGDNTEIFVVNPDGSENKRLTNTRKIESNPVWSKDGRHIVYLASDPEVYNPAIYIMRANGHSPTQVSKTDGFIMFPTYIAQ